MNFEISFAADVPSCSITKTGAALGGEVYGSLKMARAALEAKVNAHIAATREKLKAALKVPDGKLPVEVAEAAQ